MMLRWSHIIIPVFGAICAFQLSSLSFWEELKPSILTVLSVIAAGVLVRLSRGLPFTNPDNFELEEIQRITKAAKQSIRALRALVGIVFLTMVFLIFSKNIADAFSNLNTKWTALGAYIDPSFSCVIGFLLSYVFVRVFSVISGDVGIIDLQAQFFVKAVQRRKAESFTEVLETSNSPKMKNPEGYGKILQ